MYFFAARALWKPLSLICVCTGIFLFCLLFKPVPPTMITLEVNLFQATLEMVALLIALPILIPKRLRDQAIARSSRHWQNWWMPTGSLVPLLLACAILSNVIGQVIWTINENVLQVAVLFPSWADVGFLAFYPFVLLGILFLPHQRRSFTNRSRVVFDAVIAMIGVVTCSWYFVLGPTAMQRADNTFSHLISTAYPLSTLLLILCLILLTVRNNIPEIRPAIFLLFLALTVLIFTNTVYDYQQLHNLYMTGGSLLDLGWPVGILLFGLAARAFYVLPPPAPPVRTMENISTAELNKLWKILIPFSWVPTLVLLLLFIWLRGEHHFMLVMGVVVGAVVLLSLLLLRQFVALRELHTLYINNDALAVANIQLEIQATHDSLTGLQNRSYLQRRLEEEAHRAHENNIPAALLLLDLDRFKEVNDTLGHSVGDLLLQKIGRRLQSRLRPTDLLARLGGDEFAILLPATDAAAAILIARTLLSALDTPILVEEHAFVIGGSIGIALTPEHGLDVTTLLRCADVAMYVAKRSQSGYAEYALEVDQHSPRKLSLMSELRQAIADDGLIVYYQPKISYSLDRMVGVEALVRWHHPVHGFIPPNDFIPMAEHTGLIGPLTRWVLDQAIRQCRLWEQVGLHMNVAVNLSTHTLYDPKFLATVSDMLQLYEVSPSQLTLEITESMIMEEPDRANRVLSDLRSLGVSIAIDDFGTGYSSLAYLKRLPIDEVKIDKAFISGLGTNAEPADAAIVQAVVAMARPLHCKVVAEGVENAETWEFLCELGCDLAQGYYFSHPLPAESLVQWARTSHWGTSDEEWLPSPAEKASAHQTYKSPSVPSGSGQH